MEIISAAADENAYMSNHIHKTDGCNYPPLPQSKRNYVAITHVVKSIAYSGGHGICYCAK